MKRSYEVIAAIGLTTAVALGATACGGPSNEAKGAACVGLDFASPKGGPGAIQMRVFPKFNRNFGDARPMTVTGKVVDGNDTGAQIDTPPQSSGYGQFTFTWDTHETVAQSSEVNAEVTFQGNTYKCPPTTVHFDPKSYQVEPHLPNSPY
jgi:hypothetical protein